MTASEITMNSTISNINHSTGKNRAVPSQRRLTAKNVQPETIPGSINDTVSTSTSSLQALNSSLNGLAKDIRAVDESMGQIEKIADQMKSQLERVVKNYPPFPPGSEERVKLLKSFNTFRKEINQLTIPPNEELAMKIMANPELVPGAGNFDIETDKDGSRKTIHAAQIHTGPDGLDIPQLPEDAAYEEIVASINNLDVAREKLNQKRAELYEDVIGLKKSANEENSGAEEENSAELKSEELKSGLMGESTSSLTKAHPQLADFL
jgi:prefoldin subunit 5